MTDAFSTDTLASLARVEALAGAFSEQEEREADADQAAFEEYLDTDDATKVARENTCDRLALCVNECDQLAAQDMSVGAQLMLAQNLKNAEENLRDTRKMLERQIVEQLPVGATVGDAEVEWDTGWRKVQWEELLSRVVAKVSDEPGVLFDANGDRVPAHESARIIARRVNDCIGFRAPKTTGLDPLGIQADEYAERKAGPVIRWKKPQ